MTFETRLKERIRKIGSHLCVGLDPRPECIDGDVYDFLRRVVDEVADAAAVFKPNVAYFEALGAVGYALLDRLLRELPDDVPVILDAKRSDIPETQAFYARAYFETWNVDAVTLNPYLGFDSCAPFLRYPDKGVYLLAITSNEGCADVQLKKSNGHYVFEHIAEMIEPARSFPATLGFVVGLTQLSGPLMDKIPDVPLLVPGLGAQGGDLRQLAGGGRTAPIVVNVSRSLLYNGSNGFRAKAETYREKINDVLHR